MKKFLWKFQSSAECALHGGVGIMPLKVLRYTNGVWDTRRAEGSCLAVTSGCLITTEKATFPSPILDQTIQLDPGTLNFKNEVKPRIYLFFPYLQLNEGGNGGLRSHRSGLGRKITKERRSKRATATGKECRRNCKDVVIASYKCVLKNFHRKKCKVFPSISKQISVFGVRLGQSNG